MPEMAMGRVYVRNHGFPPLAVSSSINSSRKFYAHPSSNSFMLCRCQRTLLLCADLVLTPAREGGEQGKWICRCLMHCMYCLSASDLCISV